MKYMLDTNTVVAVSLDIDPGTSDRMADEEEGAFVMSAISLAELAYGTQRGKPTAIDQLMNFTEEVPVLPFDERAAHAYAALPLKRNSYDRLIAAHALSLGLTVVTSNVKDFEDVPGLSVENWTT